MKQNIEPITADSALAFGVGGEDLGSNVRFYGLFEDSDFPSTIAAVASPLSREIQKRYSNELVNIELQDSSRLEELLLHFASYFSSSKLNDLAIRADLVDGVELDGSYVFEDGYFVWRNPRVSYYIYKISSRDAPGYYFGRRAIRVKDAIEADCLKDPYMGSGGSKFKEWLAQIDPSSIVKEVVSIHGTWGELIGAEKATIGELYKTDEDCLNMQPGGLGWATPGSWIQLRDCPLHGECPHNGLACCKCAAIKRFNLTICENHGETYFNGSHCMKCYQARLYEEKECETHGTNLFRKSDCLKCLASSSISLRHCSEHGFVKHIGEVCSTCNSRRSISQRECPKHGPTTHQGEKCSTCNAEKSITLKVCSTHGETKHSGEHCMKCNAGRQLSTRSCPVHGEVTFKGNSCTNCTAEKSVSLKICSKHGKTKHQGNVCNRCNAARNLSKRECSVHGLTTHQGSVCNRCNAESSVSLGNCSTHGETKFQGQGCVKCRNAKLIVLKDCEACGMETKHKGSTCLSCAQKRRRKSEDILRDQGLAPADVAAAGLEEGSTISGLAKKFGLSKYHVKKILNG